MFGPLFVQWDSPNSPRLAILRDSLFVLGDFACGLDGNRVYFWRDFEQVYANSVSDGILGYTCSVSL